jgi:superoxide dismutase
MDFSAIKFCSLFISLKLHNNHVGLLTMDIFIKVYYFKFQNKFSEYVKG